jgi:nitrate/nitrite transport system ATP-binding protein
VVFQNHSLLPWLTCYENVYLAVERVFAATESKAQLQGPHRRRAGAGRPDAGHAEAPRRNLRRHEAARGHRPRAGDGTQGAADGRALRRARRAHPRPLQDELLAIVQKTQSTVVMVTHDVDEAVLLSDRIVMMTNGPSATIGEVLSVGMPRPRNRVELAEDRDYVHARKAVIDFLYTRQAHVEKTAA